MKTLFGLIIGSVLVGLGLGAALAYYEVRPPSPPASKNALVDLEGQGDQSEKEAPKLPKVMLSETEFEFDRIERGASMKHDFSVKNIGDATLAIQFVSNTCKCTGVAMGGELVEQGETLKIEAGESTTITLEWAAKTPAGVFRHGARFASNDPRKSSFQLMVSGDVVESTSMRPSEFHYGTIKAGEIAEAHIYLMSFLDQEAEVVDYELSPPELAEQLTFEIADAAKENLPKEALSGIKITGRYTSDNSLGPFHGWLTLKTNLPKAETLMVPINGTVTGPVSIFGPLWNSAKGVLNIGAVLRPEGKVVRLNLMVNGPNAMTTQFRVASVDPPELKVSLGEPQLLGEEVTRIPLEIEISPYTKPMVRMGEPTSSDGVVVLESDHPLVKEVKMRVHFAVRR